MFELYFCNYLFTLFSESFGLRSLYFVPCLRFVHFNTVREATEAVRLLDKFPLGVGIPRLKVSFALSPEEKERRAREKQVCEKVASDLR